MAGEDVEELYFYDIYAADVNGADVYFDSEYMGKISNGVLTVRVISEKSRPYYRVTLSKTGYSNTTASLPKPERGLQHVSLFLTMTPSASQTGMISLSSSPSDAHYFLDDGEQGDSPDMISSVLPGTHTIRVLRSGYTSWEETIVVEAGETVEVFASLKKKHAFGTISLNSDPAGAEIYIDQWYYGITPMTIGGISEGLHDIELKKDGCTYFTETVDVIENTVTPVTCSLSSPASSQEKKGMVLVSSSPAGAVVFIDSVPRGETPVTVTDLGAGVHEVKLTHTGYQDYLNTISLADGETRTTDIKMEPVPSPLFSPAPLIPLIFSLIAALLPAAGRFQTKKRQK